jgi:ribonuclease-3
MSAENYSRYKPFFNSLAELQTTLGYKFKNVNFLVEALSHPSAPAYFKKLYPFANQRLEFLGDTLLQFVVTQKLYEMFPSMTEGDLSQIRARLVSREVCNMYAAKLELHRFVLTVSNYGARTSSSTADETDSSDMTSIATASSSSVPVSLNPRGSGNRTHIFGDALEAIIAAIFMDNNGGLEHVNNFVLSILSSEFESLKKEALPVDNPKGKLQQTLLIYHTALPIYKEEVRESSEDATAKGKDFHPLTGTHHLNQFTFTVTWLGIMLGMGSGPNKKVAHNACARVALEAKLWEQAVIALDLQSRADDNAIMMEFSDVLFASWPHSATSSFTQPDYLQIGEPQPHPDERFAAHGVKLISVEVQWNGETWGTGQGVSKCRAGAHAAALGLAKWTATHKTSMKSSKAAKLAARLSTMNPSKAKDALLAARVHHPSSDAHSVVSASEATDAESVVEFVIDRAGRAEESKSTFTATDETAKGEEEEEEGIPDTFVSLYESSKCKRKRREREDVNIPFHVNEFRRAIRSDPHSAASPLTKGMNAMVTAPIPRNQQRPRAGAEAAAAGGEAGGRGRQRGRAGGLPFPKNKNMTKLAMNPPPPSPLIPGTGATRRAASALQPQAHGHSRGGHSFTAHPLPLPQQTPLHMPPHSSHTPFISTHVSAPWVPGVQTSVPVPIPLPMSISAHANARNPRGKGDWQCPPPPPLPFPASSARFPTPQGSQHPNQFTAQHSQWGFGVMP